MNDSIAIFVKFRDKETLILLASPASSGLGMGRVRQTVKNFRRKFLMNCVKSGPSQGWAKD